jgi:RNA polymerase sigma-70 factor (ECF subfamily)
MADEAALAQVQKLFLMHSSVLRGFILGLVVDFDAADDVLHEVFLAVSAKAAEFNPGSDFLGWARAFARHKAMEHLRARKRSHPVLSPDILETLAESAPLNVEDFTEHKAALSECLGQVAGRSREVLQLRYLEGLAPGDIAARISWKVGAVNVALSRARRFLRECAGKRLAALRGR